MNCKKLRTINFKYLWLSLLLVVLGILGVACKGEEETTELKIVADGVSDYVIVCGADPTYSELGAAIELRDYIKEITGTTLAIVRDNKEEVEKEIVVGKTNREAEGDFDRQEFGADGFVIKTTGDKLWLVGGETRGTLYAVYTFLEEYLGCRFYTSTVEKIPETKDVTIPQIEENKQIPVFVYRDMTYDEGTIGNFAAKLKMNGTYASTDVVHGSHYTFAPYFVHTFAMLTDTDVERQPCLTDPEILNRAIEKIRHYLKNDPNNKIIEVSQNDNSNYCICDNCNRVFEEEGSQAGAIIRFVNAIAEEFAEEYPDVIFHTIAYAYSQVPPKVTKPADNVAVRLCPIDSCYTHPFDLETNDPERYESVKNLLAGDIDFSADHRTDGLMDAKNIYFMEDLKGWLEICDKITIWQYSTNCSHTQLHYPNFDTMLINAKLYADSNVIGVFDMGNGFKTSDFPELRAYIMAKVMWDPYMSEEEYWSLIYDFLEGVYGPGWQEMRNYIEYTNELVDDVCCKSVATEIEDAIGYNDYDLFFVPEIKEVHPLDTYPEELNAEMIRNYENVDWSAYWNWYAMISGEEPEYLTYADKCFAKATEMAENDQQRSIIEKTYVQVAYYRSWYNVQKVKVGTGEYFCVTNMLKAYFEDHSEEFTEEEQKFYRDNIISLASQQAYEPIINYNKQLYEVIKKYNIDQMREGRYINFAIDPETYINFKVPPDEWI